MSYDVSVDVNYGNEGYTEDLGNFTSNIDRLLKSAIHLRLSDFDKMTTKDAFPFLEHAICVMGGDVDKYTALANSEWGSLEHSMKFLHDLAEYVRTHQVGGTILVSW